MQFIFLSIALCGTDPAPTLPQGPPPEVANVTLGADGRSVVVREFAVLLTLIKAEMVIVNSASKPGAEVAPGEIPVSQPGDSGPVPGMAANADRATAQRLQLDGRQFLVRRRLPEAIAAFEQALAAAPGDPANCFFLAFAQREARQLDQAEKSVKRAADMERGGPTEPLGLDWERFQGPSRAWLSDARVRAHSKLAPAQPVNPATPPTDSPNKTDA